MKSVKKIVSLITAAALSLSFVGTVALADGVKKYTFLSTEGHSNSSVYTTEAYLFSKWQQESSAIGVVGDMEFSDGKKQVTTISLKDIAYLRGMHDNVGEVTSIGEHRYLVMPLLEKGKTTPNNTYKKVFSEVVPGFASATISADLLKGANTVITGNWFTKIRMGLAYIPYAGGSHTYQKINETTNQYCYPADIAWIDITNDFPDYNTTKYTKYATFEAKKTTVSYPVSYIINNGEHKYINGATNQTPLTAENANAVVFDIELQPEHKDDFTTGNTLVINNIVVTVPTVEATSKGETEYITFTGEIDNPTENSVSKAGFAFVNASNAVGSTELSAYWTENDIQTVSEKQVFGAAIEKVAGASSAGFYAIPYAVVGGAPIFGGVVPAAWDVEE